MISHRGTDCKSKDTDVVNYFFWGGFLGELDGWDGRDIGQRGRERNNNE